VIYPCSYRLLCMNEFIWKELNIFMRELSRWEGNFYAVKDLWDWWSYFW
jgi:hypothetical protein